MNEDAHNTIKELLKSPYISKITFTKKGFIKVKFLFAQNKVKYNSMTEILDTLEHIQAIHV